VHLVGFITKKFVTMHGHMNVKFADNLEKQLCISENRWSSTWELGV